MSTELEVLFEPKITDIFEQQMARAASRLIFFGKFPNSIAGNWENLSDVKGERLLFQAYRVRKERKEIIEAIEKQNADSR